MFERSFRSLCCCLSADSDRFQVSVASLERAARKSDNIYRFVVPKSSVLLSLLTSCSNRKPQMGDVSEPRNYIKNHRQNSIGFLTIAEKNTVPFLSPKQLSLVIISFLYISKRSKITKEEVWVPDTSFKIDFEHPSIRSLHRYVRFVRPLNVSSRAIRCPCVTNSRRGF